MAFQAFGCFTPRKQGSPHHVATRSARTQTDPLVTSSSGPTLADSADWLEAQSQPQCLSGCAARRSCSAVGKGVQATAAIQEHDAQASGRSATAKQSSSPVSTLVRLSGASLSAADDVSACSGTGPRSQSSICDGAAATSTGGERAAKGGSLCGPPPPEAKHEAASADGMRTRSSEACALHTARGSQSADGSFMSADLSHGADTAAHAYLSLRERHTMSGDIQNLAFAARYQPRDLPFERQAPERHPQHPDSGSFLSGSKSEESFAKSPLSLRQRHTMSNAIQSLTLTANQASASSVQQRPQQQQQQQQQQQPMRRSSAPPPRPPPEACVFASGAKRFPPQLQRFQSAEQAITVPQPTTTTVVSQSLFQLLASCQQQGEKFALRMQPQKGLAPAPAAAADASTSTATTPAAAVPNADPLELAAAPAAHIEPDLPQGAGRTGAEDAHCAMAAAAGPGLEPAALRPDPAHAVPSPRRQAMQERARQASVAAADPLRVAASHAAGPAMDPSSVSAQEHPRKSTPTVSQVVLVGQTAAVAAVAAMQLQEGGAVAGSGATSPCQ